MKRNAGIYLILISIVVTTIGSILKIRHANGADFFLASGDSNFPHRLSSSVV
jgi:hypothetical protein